MSTIQDKSKEMAKKLLNVDKIQNLVSSTSKLTIAIGVIILFIMGGYIYWNYSLASIPGKKCREFSNVYLTSQAMTETGLDNSNFDDDGAGCDVGAGDCPTGTWSTYGEPGGKSTPILSSYRVKTAYNCCALTNFQNTYVNICALEACIAQGYRALDFEIYLVNGKAQIAVSSKASVHVKTSYNAIPCSKAFNTINNYAFNTTKCPNSRDPLILILRIKSNNVSCHNSIAHAIETTIKDKLVDITRYGKEGKTAQLANGVNDIPAADFIDNKILIFVDDSANGGKLLPVAPGTTTEPTNQSKLWKYTHGTIGPGAKQIGMTTYNDLVGGNKDTEIAKAKLKMMIVYPSYSPNANSIPIIGCKPEQSGCDGPIGTMWFGSQLIGTCNQSVLDPIKLSNDGYFRGKARSWVLRNKYYLPASTSMAAPPEPAANTMFAIKPVPGVNMTTGKFT